MGTRVVDVRKKFVVDGIVYFITSLESDLLWSEIAFTREAKPSVEKAIERRNITFETSDEHYFLLRYR
jgi:hypothetical protein